MYKREDAWEEIALYLSFDACFQAREDVDASIPSA